MTDDYSDDITTTGLLFMGGAPTAGTFEAAGDADWFRVDVQRYHSYAFEVLPVMAGETSYELRFYDQAGTELATFRADDKAPKIYAPYDGAMFVGVTSALPFTGPLTYTVAATPSTVDPGVHGGEVLARTQYYSSAVIEGDTDILKMHLASTATYTFDVFGSDSIASYTLTDPRFEVRDTGSAFSQVDDNSGWGRDARLVLANPPLAANYERFELVVSGANGSTGSYQLRVTATDDHVTGPLATDTIDLSQVAPGNSWLALGALELTPDIDWFRLPLNLGDAVILSGYSSLPYPGQIPLIAIADGVNQTWLTSNKRSAPQDPVVFVADETRDYFVVVRNRSQGIPTVQYSVATQKSSVPRLYWAGETFAYRFDETYLAGNFSAIQRDTYESELLDHQDGFQVWSDKPFLVDGVLYPAGAIEQFEAPEKEIQLPAGQQDFFVRFTNDNRPISDWVKGSLYFAPVDNRQGFEGTIGADGFLSKREFTFAFADTKPDYLAGEPWEESFAGLTTTQRTLMRSAIREWDDPLQLDFREVDLNSVPASQVDILIYRADLGAEPFVNPQSNPASNYDVVLNSHVDYFDNPTEGSRGFYEMLRATGKSMGAVENDNANREQSLFGLRFGGGIESEIFPSTPTYHDLMRATWLPGGIYGFQNMYGADTFFNNGDTTYRLSGTPFVRTIVDFVGGFNSIDASQQVRRATIDLRPGQVSYSGVWTDRPHTFYNAVNTSLVGGVGGAADDWISGSGLQNVLRGGAGNDVLIGRQLDDFLFGGSGHDRYEYWQSDGSDIIDEQHSGGIDTLLIQGMSNVDSFAEDLQFQRTGNDLLISLDFDGMFADRSDQITIRNFANPLSQVESLQLQNQNGYSVQVSLPSVFALADGTSRHFRAGIHSDAYGQIVVPV